MCICLCTWQGRMSRARLQYCIVSNHVLSCHVETLQRSPLYILVKENNLTKFKRLVAPPLGCPALVSCRIEIKYALARAIVKTNGISDFMKYIDFYTNTINQNINIYDYRYYYFSFILFASLTFVLYNLAFILIRNVGIVYPTCCFMLVTIFRGYLFSLILYFVRLQSVLT